MRVVYYGPDRLPPSFLRTRWIYDKRFLETLSDYKPGPFGKVRKIRNKLVVLDACYLRGEIHGALVARLSDHPFLRHIPDNSPRAVRSIYRAEVRLAHHKATDGFPVYEALDRARAAWSRFVRDSGWSEWWPFDPYERKPMTAAQVETPA